MAAGARRRPRRASTSSPTRRGRVLARRHRGFAIHRLHDFSTAALPSRITPNGPPGGIAPMSRPAPFAMNAISPRIMAHAPRRRRFPSHFLSSPTPPRRGQDAIAAPWSAARSSSFPTRSRRFAPADLRAAHEALPKTMGDTLALIPRLGAVLQAREEPSQAVLKPILLSLRRRHADIGPPPSLRRMAGATRLGGLRYGRIGPSATPSAMAHRLARRPRRPFRDHALQAAAYISSRPAPCPARPLSRPASLRACCSGAHIMDRSRCAARRAAAAPPLRHRQPLFSHCSGRPPMPDRRPACAGPSADDRLCILSGLPPASTVGRWPDVRILSPPSGEEAALKGCLRTGGRAAAIVRAEIEARSRPSTCSPIPVLPDRCRHFCTTSRPARSAIRRLLTLLVPRLPVNLLAQAYPRSPADITEDVSRNRPAHQPPVASFLRVIDATCRVEADDPEGMR